MPTYETHYPKEFTIHNTNTYQQRQRQAALALCDGNRHAIDIGANIGLWARDFCEYFDHVTLFEPDELNRQCLTENLKHHHNKTIHPYGLYSSAKSTTLFGGDHTCGNKAISKEAIQELSDDKSDYIVETQCELKVLDEYNLQEVDLMKLDTQGSELEILKGALDTIQRCGPTICVEITTKNEQQKREAQVVYDFFDSIGYHLAGGIKKDKVFKRIRQA